MSDADLPTRSEAAGQVAGTEARHALVLAGRPSGRLGRGDRRRDTTESTLWIVLLLVVIVCTGLTAASNVLLWWWVVTNGTPVP